MSFVIMFLVVLVLILVGLNVYAIRSLFSKDVYTKEQIPLLIGVIIFVPFVGASLVLYLARTKYEGSVFTHSTVDGEVENVHILNNYNIDGSE
ncbi:hypothetical protein [Undibacterium flavidum]|uniref:Uncharacterized protein n=1 Tax=Undibacterium flavidum TaxID=2762297 RepID=A0ABR6Y9U5_9BURK|nr:hypothetical protein [Undibacterium flavidum]MBC3873417.1 hypothetical protein [Undibacterium flavidum]